MKRDVKERREYTDWLIQQGKGQVALIKIWLKKYNIPYRDKDIQWSFNKEGSLKSFEINLDKELMLKDFANESLTPDFIKSGKITISVIFSE